MPEAFPPQLLAALRALALDGLGSPLASNGRRPLLPLESAGQIAAHFPDGLGRRASRPRRAAGDDLRSG